MKDNGDGSATISCPDGSSIKVTNGTNGTAGTNGTNGTNGVSGTSCTVAQNPDAGTKTVSCSDGTSVVLKDGTNGVDANAVIDFALLSATDLASLDLQITVTSISNAARPVVSFTVRDVKGAAVKGIPPTYFSGISLLQLVPGTPTSSGNGLNVDTWVSHISNCATCTPSTETASSTSLVDNGNGSYRYTFVKDIQNPTAYDGGSAVAGVACDMAAPHRFGMRLASTGSPFRPVNVVHDYIPNTGANITGQNDKVSGASCLECHAQFRANALNIGGTIPFHGGLRYDVQYCVVCHNDQRKYSGSAISGNAVTAEPTIDSDGNMTPPAGRTSVSVIRGEAVINMPVWIHKIHMGDELHLKGPYAGLGAEINEIAFPQSPSNCAKCHKNAAQADNWKNKPNRRACGACHDGVDYTTGVGHGPSNMGGAQPNDNSCSFCHTPAKIASAHIPVAGVDPNNIFSNPDGGNANTNASALGNAANPPPNAIAFTYAMPTGAVTAVPVDGGVNAQVKFKLVTADAGVVFNSYDGGNELVDNFVGSPSVYCAFALPQDGISAPADFNNTVSGYLKNIWKGTATGTGAGTLSGPDSSGYYTVRLTGVTIPSTATMLTCGIGYTYGLSSTPPMVQTNLVDYPYNATTKVGGLSIPPPNIWQVATGYAGRRGATSSASATGQIVSTAKCLNCHNTLGVAPSFHAGQRNDGATCSFCHTQNRTSSGWSAGSESFVHAIHAAGMRSVPFNWHAPSASKGYYEIAYPGRLQMCESCHNPGYYDFSNSWYTEARMQTRLAQTVATGSYNTSTTASLSYTGSPYVVLDGGVNYGAGYSFNASTGVITEAAGTTLVNSPITNVCFSCHDAERSVLHMKSNGGEIYSARSTALTTVEQCLICHGPGKTAAIRDVHYQ